MRNKQLPFLFLNAVWIVAGAVACYQVSGWFMWLYLGIGIGMVPYNLTTFFQNEIDAHRTKMVANGWLLDRKVRYRVIREVEQPHLESQE